jgi:hypothetical protein
VQLCVGKHKTEIKLVVESVTIVVVVEEVVVTEAVVGVKVVGFKLILH